MPLNLDFECGTCRKEFPAGRKARDNHCRATGHSPPDFECAGCERWFHSQRACDQHMDAKGHWPDQWPFECNCCYETWRTEKQRVEHEHEVHNYCADCNREFQSYNNLKMHLNSRIHRGQDIECPFCKRDFVTATGLTHHLESGSCPSASGMDREKLFKIVRSKDPQGLISKNLIGFTDFYSYEANWRSWNGDSYECYLCHRDFSQLAGLNQHLNSPRHQQALYHCPNRSCDKDFKSLAGIINHLESEACGCTRFEKVQRQIENVIKGNRLITF
ncbi:Zinc finger Xfin-like protein [Cladobotryum mycophilum]|uniref:Zinc finger Xfin-like protein n=1 Tax=Cladobotryum mycophilum TaxID=491253 RepID=A0ABR0SRK9_9HYPO